MKLYKSILALMTAVAVSAGFSSCENDFDCPPVISPESTDMGDGSPASPYTVQGVLLKIYQGNYEEWRDYYVKGIVSKIDTSSEFNPSYGNITYYISDDGTETSQFEIYRGLGLNGEKFNSYADLKIGDEVVVVCKLTYYNQSVAETKQGAALVSLNGTEYEKVEFPEPAGNGSAADPLNVMGMLQYTFSDNLDSKATLYVKGKVSRIDASSFNSQYGNLNYYISDTGLTANEYYIFRGLGLNGAKFASADAIKVGDEVIIKCTSTLYNESVAETNQGATIVSLNGSSYDENAGGGIPEPGEGEASEATGEGTAASPYNVAKALEVIKALAADTPTDAVYVTGTVCELGEFSDSYGNYTYTISDDGKTGDFGLLVYRGKYFNGDKFSAASQLKVGDVVVLSGTLVNFKGNTPEVNAGSKIISINGETSGTTTPDTPDTPSNPDTPTTGNGSKDQPWGVDAVISGAATGICWTEGYIVGWIDGKTLAEGAKFDANATSNTNLMIAAAPGTTDLAKCVPVQLPAGEVRTALNLKDHPDNFGKKVILYGSIEKYFGANGIKSVTEYVLDGQGGGTTPETPATGDALYSGLIDNMDGWTIDNVNLPAGLEAIWSWKVYNNAGYLNASAYKDGANASEAYCYTTVDLTKASAATLTFDHAAKFQTTLRTKCSLVVREAGASTWTKVNIPTWPEAGAWTFASSGAIDLKAYAGKKIEIGFCYGSTADGADTWEIKNFIIK